MSYILEALRRAETERERKRRVPGLHAQPVAVLPVEESSAPRSTVWRWVALGLAGGLLLALLWRWWSGEPAADEQALSPRTAVAGNVSPHPGPADPAAAPPPAPIAEAPPAPAAAPTPTAEHPPTRAQAQPSPAAQPTTKPEPRPTTRPATPTAAKSAHPTEPPAATAAAATTPSTRVTPAAQVANPATASSAQEPPLRTLSELPLDLQRAVPALSFGGSVYSELPAQRMVILNGQVLREGDAVSDEIRLEEIRPHSAVMRLRGQRFEMPF